MNFCIDSMYDILLWMTCTQKLKNSYKAYFKNNLEIKLIDDILKSYSHAKMDKMFENDNLKILFEFFVQNHKIELLSHYRGMQKTRYEAEIDQILREFRHSNQFVVIE